MAAGGTGTGAAVVVEMGEEEVEEAAGMELVGKTAGSATVVTTGGSAP